MKMSLDELARCLEEADRIRAILRRCTLEWRTLGDEILSRRGGRSGEPERSDERRTSRRRSG